MEILLEKKENNEASLKVQLTEKDYLPSVESKLKEYSKTVQLKGFRPGKVPAALVKKMYGKSIMFEEIQNVAFTNIYDYLRDNNILIFGRPLPDVASFSKIDWDNQKDFSFIYNVGLQPEVKLPALDKLKVNKFEIELTEEVINETINDLKNRFSKMESVEKSEEGDTVNGKAVEADGAKEFNMAIPTSKLKKDALKTFKGISAGAELTFDIENLFDDIHELMHVTGLGHDAVHDLKGSFKLTVETVNRPSSAQLDQDFFDQVFGKDAVKTEDEFMAKLKETVTENYKRESDYFYKITLDKALMENVSLDLPADFLKNWIKTSNEGKYTDEQIENDWDKFVNGIKQDLIYNKLAQEHKIEVSEDEIREQAKNTIRSMFYQYGLYDITDEMIEPQVKLYLESKEHDNYSKMKEQVLDIKVFETLKANTKPTHKTVDYKQFLAELDKK
jgi:trigger factor